MPKRIDKQELTQIERCVGAHPGGVAISTLAEESVDYAGEEPEIDAAAIVTKSRTLEKEEEAATGSEQESQQSPEKMEAVLNHGMSFIGGLLEMATGKKIEAVNDDRLIRLDKETGEVTMKFKLPGF